MRLFRVSVWGIILGVSRSRVWDFCKGSGPILFCFSPQPSSFAQFPARHALSNRACDTAIPEMLAQGP